MQTVELHQAFVWTCDHCGRDNFERAVLLEPESMQGTDEAEAAEHMIADATELMEAMGAEVGTGWLTMPERVQCQHCSREYGVQVGPADEP